MGANDGYVAWLGFQVVQRNVLLDCELWPVCVAIGGSSDILPRVRALDRVLDHTEQLGHLAQPFMREIYGEGTEDFGRYETE